MSPTASASVSVLISIVNCLAYPRHPFLPSSLTPRLISHPLLSSSCPRVLTSPPRPSIDPDTANTSKYHSVRICGLHDVRSTSARRWLAPEHRSGGTVRPSIHRSVRSLVRASPCVRSPPGTSSVSFSFIVRIPLVRIFLLPLPLLACSLAHRSPCSIQSRELGSRDTGH